MPLALMLIAGAWLFLGLLESVVARDALLRVDSAVYYLLQGMRTPLGDAAMIALSELGDAAVTIPVVVAVLLWLLWRDAWRVAGYWLGAAAFAAALVPALEAGLRLPRPLPKLYDGAYDLAFPSSHAAMSFVVYGFLGVLLGQGLSARGRRLVFVIAVPLIFLIAFSRLYLGAHWLSDVLGALAFGAAWVALLAVAYVRHRPPMLPAGRLAAVSLATVLVAGGLDIGARHAADTERYAVRQQFRTLAEQAWWDGGWRTLPARRLDMEGRDYQPLTLQWAGSLDALRERLGAAGWQTPPALTARSALLLFDTALPAMRLPLLPRVHDGRNQALALIRAVSGAADQRLVLRLWPAGAVLAGQAEPLWVGAVTQETTHRPLDWLNLPQDGKDYDKPREVLLRALAGLEVREVERSETARPPENSVRWDGRVLLARPKHP